MELNTAEQKAAFLEFLREGKTKNIIATCEKVGITYSVVQKWRRLDTKFAADYFDIIETVKGMRIELAECKLMENIEFNDNAAIMFFLKTQGRHLGYGDKVDISQTVTHTIGIDEAARRIAFAMNAAIDRGDVVEGDFSEIIDPLHVVRPALPARSYASPLEIAKEAEFQAKAEVARAEKDERAYKHDQETGLIRRRTKRVADVMRRKAEVEALAAGRKHPLV